MNKKNFLFVLPLFALILTGFLGFTSAATLNVGAGQTYTTIQSAITAATGGNTINVSTGMYNENLTICSSSWHNYNFC